MINKPEYNFAIDFIELEKFVVFFHRGNGVESNLVSE